MRKLILSLAATPLILGSMAVSAQAADDGFNIFSDVKFKGELRTRYQYLDIDKSTLDAANIITNRTNLNMSAKLFEVDGLNGEMELNAVNDFGSQYSSGSQIDKTPGSAATANKAGEVAVAKISQANISYTVGGSTGIIGRKTVNLDNQRFIGAVGWKQNFQTYDLAAYAYGNEGLSVLAAYVYGVNTIGDAGYDYGQGVKFPLSGSGRTNSILVNASYKIMDPIKVTGYAYLLGSASDTYGAYASGKIAMGDSAKLNYRAEVAIQTTATLTTYADGDIGPGNPQAGADENSLYGDAAYLNLDVGANISGFLVGLNYEVLGGADKDDAKTSSFQTPLATKHKFNGWADNFLTTPDAGLADFNVRGGYKFDTAGKLLAIYHLFSAAADGNRLNTDGTAISAGDAYGTELDLIYTVKVPNVNGLGLLVKAAIYADDDKTTYITSDKTMAWVQLDYKFSTK